MKLATQPLAPALLSLYFIFSSSLAREPWFESHHELLITTPSAFADPSPDILTPHYSSLRIEPTKFVRSKLIQSVQRNSSSAKLSPASFGENFLIDAKFGDHEFSFLLDTGSSDTWVIKDGFRCFSYEFRKRIPTYKCGFTHEKFKGEFQGGKISREFLDIIYDDDTGVRGSFGYEDVTVGGIQVKHQQVGLADSAAIYTGYGIGSGLVGLAYPALDSAYDGGTFNYPTKQVEYSGLFHSMYKQNLVKPVFSLAIQRGQPAGYVAFGGLPPVKVSSEFAKTPIRLANLLHERKHAGQYEFYTIFPDAFVHGHNKKETKLPPRSPYFVDSGTSFTYIPHLVNQALSREYDPPARFIKRLGGFYVKCDAKPPPFGIVIGGKAIYMDPRDMIYHSLRDPHSGLCPTSFLGSSGYYGWTLGATFLRSVVAVFDVGAGEMRFAEHNYTTAPLRQSTPRRKSTANAKDNAASKMDMNAFYYQWMYWLYVSMLLFHTLFM